MDSFRFRDIVGSVMRWPDEPKPEDGFRDGWRAACSAILGRLDQALQQVAMGASAEPLANDARGPASVHVKGVMPPARHVLHLANADDAPELQQLKPGCVVRVPAQRMPEWMQYDHERDELVIHGKRFALKLFSADGLFAEVGYCLEIVRGRDDVITVKDIGERYWLEQAGADRAREGVQEVSAGFDDIAFDGQPEAWSEKPFARIAWYQDDGDPSVGQPGRSGWTLASDQAGTVIEDLAKALPAGLHEVLNEVRRATEKFPTWPNDALHAVAILGEEFGELTKAMLQKTYEPHKVTDDEIFTEAIQTAAMALRLVMSLTRYRYPRSEQHSQGEAA